MNRTLVRQTLCATPPAELSPDPERDTPSLRHEPVASGSLETPNDQANDRANDRGHALERTALERALAELIDWVGDDSERLADTPGRALRAWREITAGYRQDPIVPLMQARFPYQGGRQLVTVHAIRVNSVCEHHLLPFFGLAHIAYFPTRFIGGLSKFARTVEALARRLQLQEHLTHQIAQTIQTALEPEGLAVHLDCHHTCMALRGANQAQSRTTTQFFSGLFEEDFQLRSQFSDQCRRKKPSPGEF